VKAGRGLGNRGNRLSPKIKVVMAVDRIVTFEIQERNLKKRVRNNGIRKDTTNAGWKKRCMRGWINRKGEGEARRGRREGPSGSYFKKPYQRKE